MKLFLLMKENVLEETVAKHYIIMKGHFKYKGEKYVLFFSDFCKQNDVNVADIVWNKSLEMLKNRHSGDKNLPKKLYKKIKDIAPMLADKI